MYRTLRDAEAGAEAMSQGGSARFNGERRRSRARLEIGLAVAALSHVALLRCFSYGNLNVLRLFDHSRV